ncbi:MAG: hypothetical protein P8L37_06650 [Phycisphaerales bacterium]|nr:hypothetical protein [Phycisphaerales bacterium]
MSTPSTRPAILFTAFEPSGDALAAPIIERLKARAPGLEIFAWGGPLMEKAGATIVEESVANAAMGLGAITRARAIGKHRRAIKRWLKQYRILAHIPVDSPAANFPICKLTRKAGVKVIHLGAPQLWAWGSWRAGKLRKLTDLVLCLLPHEPTWLQERKIKSRFIGHPAINRELDLKELKNMLHGMPHGAPRLCLFPGSRPQEVRRNLRLLVRAFEELKSRHSGLTGLIVAADASIASVIRKRLKTFPGGLHMVTDQRDIAIAWCDMAIAVSGTITLHLTRQIKPMVGVYKTDILSWIGAKLLLRTQYRLLPNIIAEQEVVPEYVPHIGGSRPIVNVAARVFNDSRNAAEQTSNLAKIISRFSNKHFADEGAVLILKTIKGGDLPTDTKMAELQKAERSKRTTHSG